MVVTAIEKKSKNRSAVFVDGVVRAWLNDEVLAFSGLKPGSEISEKELQELIGLSNKKKAKERALQLLSYRDHSKAELFNKLRQKAVEEETAAQAVERMEELGLVDDSRFAGTLFDDMLNRRKYSKKRAEYELLKRGIDREYINALLSACGIDETDTICSLIKGKYLSRLGSEKGRQSVAAALYRNGFKWEDIRSAFLKFEEDNGD